MASSGTLRVKVVGDTAPFQKSMKGLTRNVGKAMKNVAKVGAAGFAAAGAAAVAGAFKVAEFGDEVAKSAGKAGLGTEQFQELRFAFGQGGVEAATMDTALMKFNKRLGESATTGGTADDAFEALNVSLRDADGNVREASGAMDEILPKLAEIESDSERAAVAGDLFGQRAGPELAAALADGVEGIDDARQKAQDLGIVMDGEAAEAAEKFTDQFDDIKQSATGLVREGLTPVMEKLSNDVFPYIQNVAIPTLRDMWEAFQEGDGILGGVRGALSSLSEGLSLEGLFTDLTTAAKNAFNGLLDWLTSGGLEQILQWAMDARIRLFDAAMELFPAILDAAIQFLPQLLNWIAGTMIPQLLDFIVSAVPQLLDTAVTLFTSLIDALVDILPTLIQTLLGDVLPAVLTAVLAMIPKLLEAGLEAFMALVEAVVKMLPKLLTTLAEDVLPSVLLAISEMTPQLLQAGLDAFLALVDAVTRMLPDLVDTFTEDVLPTLIDTIIAMSPELLVAGVKTFVALVEAIGQATPQIAEAILTEMLPAIVDAFFEIVDKSYQAGKDIVGNLIGGITSRIPDIGGAMSRVGDTIGRFLPGSPVKEGPLTVLNRGEAGRQITRMLAGGIADGLPDVAAQMNRLDAGLLTPAPALAGGPMGTDGASLGQVLAVMRDLAARPVSVQIDGREIARSQPRRDEEDRIARRHSRNTAS